MKFSKSRKTLRAYLPLSMSCYFFLPNDSEYEWLSICAEIGMKNWSEKYDFIF